MDDLRGIGRFHSQGMIPLSGEVIDALWGRLLVVNLGRIIGIKVEIELFDEEIIGIPIEQYHFKYPPIVHVVRNDGEFGEVAHGSVIIITPISIDFQSGDQFLGLPKNKRRWDLFIFGE